MSALTRGNKQQSTPERAPLDHNETSRSTVIIGTLWVILATYLQLVRQQGAPAYDTLWAEDGHLFLTTALNHPSPLLQLAAPAGGYMHLVPRSFAVIASLLPLRTAAGFFAASSALVTALLSLYVYRASAALLRPAQARAALAGLIVLLPASGFETMNNSANLHYPLMFSAFWALLARPQSHWGAAWGCCVVLAATMSDPASGLLLPVAIWSGFRNQGVRSRVIHIAFGVGLALHGLVILTGEARYADPAIDAAIREDIAARTFAPRAYADSDVLDLPSLYGLRVVAGLVLGERLLDPVWRAFGPWLALGATLVVLALVAPRLTRTDSRGLALVPVAVAYSFAFFAFPVMIRGTQHLASTTELVSRAGSRFVVVPMLFLSTAIIMRLATRPTSLGPHGWRSIQLAAVVVGVAVVLSSYLTTNPRSAGPRWSSGISDARRTCERREASYVRIKITPPTTPDSFNVLTPCDLLLPD